MGRGDYLKDELSGGGYALPGYKYYINIKRATLIRLIFLLDYNGAGGIISPISSLVGVQEKVVSIIIEMKNVVVEKVMSKI